MAKRRPPVVFAYSTRVGVVPALARSARPNSVTMSKSNSPGTRSSSTARYSAKVGVTSSPSKFTDSPPPMSMRVTRRRSGAVGDCESRRTDVLVSGTVVDSDAARALISSASSTAARMPTAALSRLMPLEPEWTWIWLSHGLASYASLMLLREPCSPSLCLSYEVMVADVHTQLLHEHTIEHQW